ncbi:uncharacterized protein LOC126370963 [Pectinophora gossypiella]|uniref:uncharacterized protein LOC126370963 n=1 Tax=Pectinophora gossypiella TaxID=13191 RepID=UPI00214DFDE8|nr:uncharacterized protein LOC126370963 [Pectinophora gossypiella]
MDVNSDREKRLSEMLFYNETRTKNDFRGWEIRPKIVTQFIEKPRKRSKAAEYRPQNHVETMESVRKAVPFHMFIKYDPILRRDPKAKQEPYEKIVHKERSKIQKNRRQCVMTPAVSLDSLKNDNQYQLLVNDMYTSTTQKALKETAAATVSRNPCKAPFPGTYAHCKPIDLQLHRPQVVPPEWRRETITWDSKQQRGHTDATEEFWLNRTPQKGPQHYRPHLCSQSNDVLQ